MSDGMTEIFDPGPQSRCFQNWERTFGYTSVVSFLGGRDSVYVFVSMFVVVHNSGMYGRKSVGPMAWVHLYVLKR